MRIWLDPDRLTKYGMTSSDVIAAIRTYNAEVSAGQLGGAPAVPGQRLNASILVQSLLVTPEEFAAIPLRTNADGSVVRVRRHRPDRARDRAARHLGRYNGQPGGHARHPAGGRRQRPRHRRRGSRPPWTDLSKYFPAGHEGRLPDGHDALRARGHRRGRQDADRGGHPRLPRDVPLPREPEGDARAHDRGARRPPRHVRRARRASATRSTC